jgi:hypothetical protein
VLGQQSSAEMGDHAGDIVAGVDRDLRFAGDCLPSLRDSLVLPLRPCDSAPGFHVLTLRGWDSAILSRQITDGVSRGLMRCGASLRMDGRGRPSPRELRWPTPMVVALL